MRGVITVGKEKYYIGYLYVVGEKKKKGDGKNFWLSVGEYLILFDVLSLGWCWYQDINVKIN